MFKKPLVLSGVGLLVLAGCGGGAQTKTFVANDAVVPANGNDPAVTANGSDYNGDGVVDKNDNALGDLNATLTTAAGLDLNVLINGAIDAGTILVSAEIT